MEGAKGLANINLNKRLKQILVLFAVMLVAMALSSTLQAQNYHQSKAKHYKSKFKKEIRQNHKVCTILAQKRTQGVKQPLFAFLKSKPKYRPQAEVDAPSYARNRQVVTAQATKKTIEVRD